MDLNSLIEKLNKEIDEGYAGKRGYPDGSGPAPGMSGKGKRKGSCPKEEDFDDEDDYKEAMKKWRRSRNAK